MPRDEPQTEAREWGDGRVPRSGPASARALGYVACACAHTYSGADDGHHGIYPPQHGLTDVLYDGAVTVY
jgi:hypothetical protein